MGLRTVVVEAPYFNSLNYFYDREKKTEKRSLNMCIAIGDIGDGCLCLQYDIYSNVCLGAGAVVLGWRLSRITCR